MPKTLYRSSKNRQILGVCGGFAEYFDVDPTVVRLIWLAGTICTGGVGLIVYLVALFIMPVAHE